MKFALHAACNIFKSHPVLFPSCCVPPVIFHCALTGSFIFALSEMNYIRLVGGRAA